MSDYRAETAEAPGEPLVQKTMRDALDSSVARRGGRPALVYFDRTFTFGEVREQAQAFSAWLQANGVGFGDRIIVQLQNEPQFIFVAAGAWEIGAVVVPLSPMYRAREVSKIAADSGARVWVTTPQIWQKQGPAAVEGTAVEQVVTTVLTDYTSTGAKVPTHHEVADGPLPKVLPVTSLTDILQNHAGSLPHRPELTKADTALFTYTSGTTGPPKAAMTSHGNLCYVGHVYPVSNGLVGMDEVIFAMAPLVHITGLAMHFAAWLTTASTLVVAHRFHPTTALEQIVQHGATWTTGTATAYMAMLQAYEEQPHSVTKLDFTGAGGSAVPTPVTRQVKETFGVELQPGYGLTETTGAVSSTLDRTPPRVDQASGVVSVGPPLPGTEVKIVDEDGKTLPPHENGEVLVRGPGVVSGYWRRENEKTFSETGWARTGDVGFLDEDGWLYIVDRTKNLIVVSGYKVWPREVEDVLYSHPDVREVAVTGAPDDYRGETVVSFVAFQDGATATAEELIAHCREQMAAYKVPSRIVQKPELPKNFNGKIQVRELKAQAAQS